MIQFLVGIICTEAALPLHLQGEMTQLGESEDET
jgi:hypothetical protein